MAVGVTEVALDLQPSDVGCVILASQLPSLSLNILLHRHGTFSGSDADEPMTHGLLQGKGQRVPSRPPRVLGSQCSSTCPSLAELPAGLAESLLVT